MTNEYREQAREIVLRTLRLRSDTELAGVYAEMVDGFASALSSRDAEIKEVLEGLVHAGVEFDDERIHYVVMQIDRETPAAAKVLYEKVSK